MWREREREREREKKKERNPLQILFIDFLFLVSFLKFVR
jgi:hypothetical protein